jgi:hypothetical protein
MNDQDLKLPALIDRAQRCLAGARTSAEVLEARAAAQAALHYAKLVKAANETQADCLKMIARAEIRMANEIDAAQARGEVAKPGGDRQGIVQDADNGSATFDDLDLDRRRVSEWRQLRDAGGEPLVERVVQNALNEGRAPKVSDIQNEVRKITVRVHPPQVIERTVTVGRLDPEETERHNLWWSVRHGIFSEQNTQPDAARAAIAVPADMRGWVAQQAKSHSRWLEKFVDRLLEEASETLPPAGEDARPH